MRKRKVLFFADGLYGGGAERVLQTVLKYLDKDLFDITLYSVKEETLNDLYPCNINYQYIFHSWNQNDGILMRLKKKIVNKFKLWIYYHLSPTVFYFLFVKGKYDVEVAFIEGYATRIVSGSTNKESKKIAWVHTDLEKNHWTQIAYKNMQEEQNVYQRYNVIVTVSNTVKEVIKRIFEIRDSYVKTIYNPIGADEISKKSRVKMSLPQKVHNIRLVSIGRLVQQKAYCRLLRIINRLVQESYSIELWILGEGGERKFLEDYIKQNHLEDFVTLWGFQTNPYAYLSHCDLFVCSSFIEGYSTAVTEALIVGLPIVTTECAGMKELLDNGKYGLITENSEDSLYWGIKKMLDNPLLLTYYRNQTSNRAKDFSIGNMLRPIEQLLQSSK